MTSESIYDVIIIGGSFAGLSAALSLGRCLRKVLIIDGGSPCNRYVRNAHNFLTHDGNNPSGILSQGKNEVLKYETIEFIEGQAIQGNYTQGYFTIFLEDEKFYRGKKLLFATGVIDELPPIKGIEECWGISLFHCPYCHAYEIRNKCIGLIANGEAGFEFLKLLSNWSTKLTLFTNEESTLTDKQTLAIKNKGFTLEQRKIKRVSSKNGEVDNLHFEDGEATPVDALFIGTNFKQHCEIPLDLGCKMTEKGHIFIDGEYRTTVEGIYAAGDNTSPLRSIAEAVGAGSKAGGVINKDLVEEEFN